MERLEKETQIDGSLNDYLDWVQNSDTEVSLYQLPEDWLQDLSTVQFSDALATTNLRSALSFKEVDYLLLAADEPGDSMWIITSDPSALRVEEAEPLVQPSLTTANQLEIHPALISLSSSGTNDPNSHGSTTLVLPVGRLLHGKPKDLLDDILDDIRNDISQDTLLDGEAIRKDSLGKGTLPTPIKHIQNLLNDVPALIDYLELPNSEMATLTNVFEHSLLFNVERGQAFWNRDQDDKGREILEKKRRELWHDITKTSKNFKETGFVVVVDAITSGHPIWIIQSPQQKDDHGKQVVASGTAHTIQIFSETKAWLRTYGKLSSGDFERMVNGSVTQTPLLARTVDLTTSDDMFTMVGGTWL